MLPSLRFLTTPETLKLRLDPIFGRFLPSSSATNTVHYTVCVRSHCVGAMQKNAANINVQAAEIRTRK